MCNACLIESVRRDALSRRHLLIGAAAAGAAAMALGPLAARPALAASSGRVVDLTHAWDETFPTFDGNPGIAYEADKTIAADGYQLWKLTIFEHSGTHVDAPM
ncbi:MAG: cyclase family protein, partial [Paracoccus sp. (in: a-proteobacteria)]|nr:cyclase family protein [Paracoccus sp. (in: a-proteobacteria)]